MEAPPDFLDAITAWAARAPDRVAHVGAGAQITYGELIGRAATLAGWIDSALPDDRRPIGVLGHREPQLLVAMLACALTNHPYVPIDDGIPAERVSRIATSASLAHLLRVADIDRHASGISPLPPRRLRSAEDLYYVMFTSGSSGEPKGVQITRGCLAAFVAWMTGEHALQPGGEVILNQANFSFDLSVMDLYLSLVSGGTLVSATRDHVANPRRLFELLRTTPLTTWVSTPTFAAMCLVERSFDATMLPTLRRFLFCGEVLPHAVASALLERFPDAEVWNTYGPTEATVATTSVRITPPLLSRFDPLPVGVAMPGTQVTVVDAAGDDAAAGERGEIVIRGPNVSRGYLGRDDLTRAVFAERDGTRAYRTGDWGRYRDELLFCEGRMDSQIKLHGYRIELGEIEVQLRRCEGVRDAVVIVIEREGAAHSLTAVVVPDERMPDGPTRDGPTRDGPKRDERTRDERTRDERTRGLELRGELARHLPAYMVPRKVRFVSQLPMTANGKVDRRAVAELLGNTT